MAPTGARHTLSSMRRQHLTETWLVLGIGILFNFADDAEKDTMIAASSARLIP